MNFNSTIDDVVLEQSTQPQNIAEKPFLVKEWSNPLYDTNTSSNYSSNQIIFDTTTLSNSGKLTNYAEGLIALPLVIKISANAITGGAVVALNEKSDFMLALKNSHVQILHSLSITLNNIDIVQNVPLTNAYLTFVQHSELSSDDEFLNAPLTGYAKDSSGSWYYATPTAGAGTTTLTGNTMGVGIGNNCNFKGPQQGTETAENYNSGMLERQKLFAKQYELGRTAVLGAKADQTLKESGTSYVKNDGGIKYIYYDCYLRLKDICPNLFNNLPMAKGMKFKFVLTLNNNISFKFKKLTTGFIQYDHSQFSNVTSQTNPLMVSAHANAYTAYKTELTGGNFVSAQDDQLVGQGLSAIPNGTEITISMRIGQNTEAHHRQQCILYVPSYTMSPKYELDYFSESRRVRKIHYTELEYQTFTARPGMSFNAELSSSCVRPKRLIMIPFLARDANEGLDPLSSPFTTEPATTSPCIISNFNCQIANVNLFPNDITYTYDTYLQQLNGQSGLNANLVNGLVSSRINMTDFQNNYHYIVCDLSRRSSDLDLVAVNIRVRGRVSSPKNIDFHCFIERERIIEIDVMTGALINRY